MMNYTKISCVLLCLLKFVAGNFFEQYELIIQSTGFTDVCPLYPEKLNGVLDMSHMEFDFEEDGNIVLSGYTQYIGNTSMPLLLTVEFKQKKGMEWVETIHTLKRTDLCTAFLDTKDLFYASYGQFIEKDKRTCPFVPGTKAIFEHFKMNPRVQLPYRKLAGEYRADVMVSYDNDFQCFTIYFELLKA